MVLGNYIIRDNGGSIADSFGGIGPILLPMTIAGVGIIASIIGSFFVSVSDNAKADVNTVQSALNKGNNIAMLLALAASFGLIKMMLPETISMSVFNAGEFSVMT